MTLAEEIALRRLSQHTPGAEKLAGVADWIAGKMLNQPQYASPAEIGGQLLQGPVGIADEIARQTLSPQGFVSQAAERIMNPEKRLEELLADMQARYRQDIAAVKAGTPVDAEAILQDPIYSVLAPDNLGIIGTLTGQGWRGLKGVASSGILDDDLMPDDAMAAKLDKLDSFENWFRGSQIVDQTGKPLVAYRGSLRDSDSFSHTSASSSSGMGPHFGSVDQANDRLNQLSNIAPTEGAPNIRPVYLDIKNPVRVNDTVTFTAEDLVPQRAIRDAIGPEAEDEYYKTIKSRPVSEQIAWLKGKLEEKGHDGLIYRNEAEGGGDSYVPFRDRQIRSIWRNR